MNMKRMIPLFAAGSLLVASTASAQFELTENLSVTGFIDMSIYSVDTDAGSDTTMGLDQWEVDFLFDLKNGTTAQVDVNDLGDGVEVEQAFVVQDLGNGFSGKAGLFLSALGYEGAEPIYLWQYSVSATIIGYPGYSNGANLSYASDLYSVSLSVLDGSYSQDGDADELSFEGQVKLFPMEGFVFQAGYASEKFDAVEIEGVTTPSYEQGIVNFWAEYATGPVTVAAEYNVLMEIGGPDGDGDGYLVMFNYAFTEKFALTLRHSGVELDNGYENTEFTVSPSYAVNDNLLILAEVRSDDFDDDSLDGESYALEVLFSF